ncbi:MAG: hypothetical protein QOG57_2016, partial [Pseudonocardiales bacterium]|nr:hypothetical protein [Pseudonocardiales bacterium]
MSEPAHDPLDLTLAQVGGRFRAGTLTPVELLDATLNRINRTNPVINA